MTKLSDFNFHSKDGTTFVRKSVESNDIEVIEIYKSGHRAYLARMNENFELEEFPAFQTIKLTEAILSEIALKKENN